MLRMIQQQNVYSSLEFQVNKADFDRKYKAIKGHMLNKVVTMSVVGRQHEVIDVYWSDTLNKLVIVTEED